MKFNLLHFSDCEIRPWCLSRSLINISTRGSVPLTITSRCPPLLKFNLRSQPLSTTGASANSENFIQDKTSKSLHSALRTELKKEMQHEPKPRSPFRDWTSLPADRFLGGEKSTIFLTRRINDEEICIVTSTEVVCKNAVSGSNFPDNC